MIGKANVAVAAMCLLLHTASVSAAYNTIKEGDIFFIRSALETGTLIVS